MLDYVRFVAPVGGDKPCGENPDADPAFAELLRAAETRPERQYGDKVFPAEEPSWPTVREAAEALLLRVKDVRVAILLTRAWTRTEGLDGCHAGLALIRQLVEGFWESVYPALDREDNDDPTMRLNAIAELTDAEGMLRDLRQLDVIGPGHFGRLSVRDIALQRAKSGGAGSDAPTAAALIGVLTQTAASPDPAQSGPARAAIDSARTNAVAAKASAEEVASLYTFLSGKVGSDVAPDLGPLRNLLVAVAEELAPLTAVAEPAAEAASGPGPSASDPAAGVPAAARPGVVATRDDALRALEQVCAFIERTEPSHPAPLFIRRAQRLLKKNFIDILQDLAPESVAQVLKQAGEEPKK